MQSHLLISSLLLLLFSNLPSTLATPPTPTGGPTLSHKPTIAAFTRLGCYTDSVHSRVLNGIGGVVGDFSGQTLDKCAATCTSRGYALFGVEYGGECWCDDVLAISSQRTADEECNFICPGDVNQFCGAGDRLELYKLSALVTGIPSSGSVTSTTAAISTTLSTVVTTSMPSIPLPTLTTPYFWLRTQSSSNPAAAALFLQQSSSTIILGPAYSAGQFALYAGAYLSQLLPGGEVLYAQVSSTPSGVNAFLSVRWQRYPGDNGVFGFNGDVLEWTGSGVSRPNRGSFWRCVGEDGLRISTKGFEVAPEGCEEFLLRRSYSVTPAR